MRETLKTLVILALATATAVSCSREEARPNASAEKTAEIPVAQEASVVEVVPEKFEADEAPIETESSVAKKVPVKAGNKVQKSAQKPNNKKIEKKAEKKAAAKKVVADTPAIAPDKNADIKASSEGDEVSLVQSAAVSSATVAPPGSNMSGSGVFGSMSVTGYSDFKETSDNSKSMYSTYELSLGYRMDAKNIFSLYVPVQKDLSQDYEEEFFADAKVSHFRRGIFRYGLLDFHHTTSFVYPTTEASKRRDEMYSGFELTPRFDLTLNKYVKGLMLIYMPRYRRRFHKYTSNRAGDYLVNESLLNIFVASWSFAPKFAFESTLVYVQNRRYDGVMTDDSYMTVQELQYAFSDKVFLNVGLQTGGAIINPERGRSQTIEIFDANMSEFYTGARVVF